MCASDSMRSILRLTYEDARREEKEEEEERMSGRRAHMSGQLRKEVHSPKICLFHRGLLAPANAH